MIAVSFLLAGCAGIPRGVEPVSDFDLNRYAGTWYEMARLDHRFERGLSNVSATYRPRPSGGKGITVVNQGFKDQAGKWQDITGKAYLKGTSGEGRLKVSFFGPFYAAYNVIDLDPEYQHAMVCGPSRSYLWILARRKSMPEPTLKDFVQKAHELGFDTDELIYVAQDRERPTLSRE